jgi:hypothetical protein
MSNTVVVDTSIVIKWVIDETDSSIAVALLARWISEGLIILAPSLLAGVLCQARKEIAPEHPGWVCLVIVSEYGTIVAEEEGTKSKTVEP